MFIFLQMLIAEYAYFVWKQEILGIVLELWQMNELMVRKQRFAIEIECMIMNIFYFILFFIYIMISHMNDKLHLPWNSIESNNCYLLSALNASANHTQLMICILSSNIYLNFLYYFLQFLSFWSHHLNTLTYLHRQNLPLDEKSYA